jgi:cellulose synthase/poly-beta-1,6-N-acetylglucosamine synthase-like glycosyltransferase
VTERIIAALTMTPEPSLGLRIAFWTVLIAGGLLAYAFAIFPMLMALLARWFGRPPRTGTRLPTVSFIVPAFNEEKVLAAKLRSLLALDYPRELTEIFVCSDCSTDRTDEIARSFAPSVTLLRGDRRGGKQVSLNRGGTAATGEILILTDASSMLDADAVRKLVRHFEDPGVGAVSSVIRIHASPTQTPDDPDVGGGNEGLYLDLDTRLRRFEGLLDSAIGCCGSCYAIRRDIWRPFHPADCDDMASAFNTIAAGKRVIFDPEAVGRMLPSKDRAAEYRRKVRTIAGGIDTFRRYLVPLMCSGRPLVWWFLFSHKICRWLAPMLLAFILVGLAVGGLSGSPIFAALAGVAIGGLGFALLVSGDRFARSLPTIVRFPGFALVSLMAGLTAWFKVIAGAQQVTWQPTKR